MSHADQTSFIGDRAKSPVLLDPVNEKHRAEIQEQLAAVLESTPFRTSKRCAGFLSHVVEKSLRKEIDDLKERAIGVNLFHRSPSYDTSSDPVVRMAAVETRRRLAQYYDGTPHPKVRIHLPNGSYVPEFYRVPDRGVIGDLGSVIAQGAKGSAEILDSLHPSGAARHLIGRNPSNGFRFAAAGFCLFLGLVAGLAADRVHRAGASQAPSALDTFWSPLISAPGAVWLCAGEVYVTRIALNPNGARNRFDLRYELSLGGQKEYPALSLNESAALARVAGFLQNQGKRFSIHGESETEISDLATGPSVLVGSFNNDWAIRLSDKLRFYFEMDPKAGEHWIADKQKPEKKIGRRVPSVGAVDGKNAFAIISRVKDPDTRQMVVSVAGLSGYGTRAAGRFVSDPSYLTEFSQNAPPNWQNANLQIVIEAPIVDRELAAPHVIDSYVW